MTYKELELANAIFEGIRLIENRPIKSCNDCWIEVDEVNISEEDLKRAALEIQHAPTLVKVEAETAFIEVDQSSVPISQTVTEEKARYSIVFHKKPRGPGVCNHFTIEEAISCERQALDEKEIGPDSHELGDPSCTSSCQMCGSSRDEPF